MYEYKSLSPSATNIPLQIVTQLKLGEICMQNLLSKGDQL